ncbi:MAG: hypothetical protein NTX50_09975 [Candidatus Sumerlaeota bacterium]|nr:hypothetical protein [Candidatus Sumerlaeota bacterium]
MITASYSPDAIDLAQLHEAEGERVIVILNRLLSHKTDSLFRFVLDLSPYVAPGDEARQQCVQDIAREHAAQAEALTRLILEMDGVPSPLGHDIGLADMNYLSLRYLVGELIRYQEHVLGESREELRTFGVFPTAASLMRDIIAQDQSSLELLKSLA